MLSILTPHYWLLISPEATPFQGVVEFLVKSAGTLEACVPAALCGTGTGVEVDVMNHWRVMAPWRRAVQRLEAGGVRAETAIRMTRSTGILLCCS